MKLKFSKEQLDILNIIGFDFDVEKDLLDEEYFRIYEKVLNYFAKHGIEKDEVNEIGRICESIMDILSEY